MNWVTEIREWTMWIFELYICWILTVEYFYDFNKDTAKKQKKTRTTKKVTESKDGQKITEESVETSEPMKEEEHK